MLSSNFSAVCVGEGQAEAFLESPRPQLCRFLSSQRRCWFESVWLWWCQVQGMLRKDSGAGSRGGVPVLEGAAQSQELKSSSWLWECGVSVLWDEEVLVLTGTGWSLP